MSLERLRGIEHRQQGSAVLALKPELLRVSLFNVHTSTRSAVVLAAAVHLWQLNDGALACVRAATDLEHLDGRGRSSLPRICHHVHEVDAIIRLRHAHFCGWFRLPDFNSSGLKLLEFAGTGPYNGLPQAWQALLGICTSKAAHKGFWASVRRLSVRAYV